MDNSRGGLTNAITKTLTVWLQVTMSSLISALDSGGEWELALQTFESLKNQGVQPNVFCYNATISALAKGSQAAKAKDLVREMQVCAAAVGDAFVRIVQCDFIAMYINLFDSLGSQAANA